MVLIVFFTTLSNGAVALVTGQTLTLSWDVTSGQWHAAVTDGLMEVVYCETLDVFETANLTGTRDATTVQLPLPAHWVGQEVYVWSNFVNTTAKLAAISTYLGKVTLA